MAIHIDTQEVGIQVLCLVSTSETKYYEMFSHQRRHLWNTVH